MNGRIVFAPARVQGRALAADYWIRYEVDVTLLIQGHGPVVMNHWTTSS